MKYLPHELFRKTRGPCCQFSNFAAELTCHLLTSDMSNIDKYNLYSPQDIDFA